MIKRIIKPLLGCAVLALLIFQLDTQQLKQSSMSINWLWFAAALLASTLNTVVSAYRWGRLCEWMGLVMPPALALKTYFQGVCANTVLPGGIVGGDVWRIGVLVTRGAKKVTAGISVLLDRVSGLWLLGALSCIAFGMLVALGNTYRLGALEWAYLSGLALIAIAPLFLRYIKPRYFSALIRTAGLSLLVQVFAVTAFWCCLLAVGVLVSPLAVMAAATFIFLAAIVPAAIGGFGSREVGAVMALAYLGIAAESSFLASVLYGLTATIQGVAGIYFWVARSKPTAA